jgi:hypothetical protein
MARYLPTKSVVYILILILMIGAMFIGLFVMKYPATTGHTQYEMRNPASFNFYEAERALRSAGFSVDADYDATHYEDSYMHITGSSDANGDVDVWLMAIERYDRLEITATKHIYIPPYGVFQDLDELSAEQHKIAANDIREVLATIGVTPTGTFTHVTEIDSLDYFIPTSAFYVIVFCQLPVIIVLTVLIVKEYKRGDAPLMDQDFSNNRTQY